MIETIIGKLHEINTEEIVMIEKVQEINMKEGEQERVQEVHRGEMVSNKSLQEVHMRDMTEGEMGRVHSKESHQLYLLSKMKRLQDV